MNKLKLAIASILILCSAQLQAKLSLPAFFSSNMVLQRNADIIIEGNAAPGYSVMLACSWDHKKYSQWTDRTGTFRIKLKTPAYGGPYTMVISAEGTAIKLDNLMIGDVWLCAGQSNMEMPLAGWGKINNYQKEIDEADYPNIRLLQVNHSTSNFPTLDLSVQDGGWKVCSPGSIPAFSSTAYFFAREVYKKTGIPIGLIHSSWGGTVAEAWMSADAVSKIADFNAALENVQRADDHDGLTKEINKWTSELDSRDQGLHSGQPIWAAKDLKNASWKEMELPAFFDLHERPNFDGVVWFRKQISVPFDWTGEDLILNLGPIDDTDVTYFDGVEIGRTQGYDRDRKYVVPRERVLPGEHALTIRVFDGGGGGGIYGDKGRFFMESMGRRLSLQGMWKYNIGIDIEDFRPMPQPNAGSNRPTVLYNAMIHPFIHFGISGVIWYQGEANAGRAKQYRTLFPALIKDWRAKFNRPNLPFYFVQLAGYARGEGDESSWPLLREAQLQALRLPYTGMAVAIDIGDRDDIHPKDKQEVGRRLALIALSKTYHKPIDDAGPVYRSMSVQGNTLQLDFANSAGLRPTMGNLTGFWIAGEDRVFKQANAIIKGGSVYLNNDSISRPVAARYAWGNYPETNFINQSGLPASPFRTDHW